MNEDYSFATPVEDYSFATPVEKKTGFVNDVVTDAGKRFNLVKEDAANPKINKFGVAADVGNLMFGLPVDIVGDIVKAALPKGTGEAVGGVVDKLGILPMEGSLGDRAIKKAAETYRNFEENSPNISKGVDLGANVATTVGLPLRAGREIPIKMGKEWLASQMKIKDVIARKGYGANMIDKKKNIINSIVENDLHKSKDFSAMHDNAMNKVNALDEQVRSAAADVAAAQEAGQLEKQSGLDVVLNALNESVGTAALGNKDKAKGIYDRIMKDMNDEGLSGPLNVQQMIDLKKKMVDKNTFKLGPSPVPEAATEAEARKLIVLKLLDEIEKVSPEIRDIGRKQKSLFDVADAADAAASRTYNRDPLSLSTKMMLGTTGIAAAGTAALTHSPEAALYELLAGGTMAAMDKLSEQGAGPRKLIALGKLFGGGQAKPSKVKPLSSAIQRELKIPQEHTPTFTLNPADFTPQAIEKRTGVKSILGNERGSVGGGGKPSWWNEQSDNPFAKEMTKGQEVDDWISRHKVPQENGKYVFYHATPVKGGATDELRSGSYLAPDPETALQQAKRDRGLKSKEMKVIKVLLNPEEVETGVWAMIRNNYKVNQSGLGAVPATLGAAGISGAGLTALLQMLNSKQGAK